MVFGWRPSARPVDVLSGLSSIIVVLMPYLTRFDLFASLVRDHTQVERREPTQASIPPDQHQPRSPD